MGNVKRNLALVLLATVGVCVTLIGCGGDDPAQPSQTGTVVIDQSPDALSGSAWDLTGPQSETGAGDMTMADMPVGEYTLTWTAVAGYLTPASDTQTLAADGTITFSGTYVEEPEDTGTVEINQRPDILAGAAWSLTGPQAETGTGDMTLSDVPVGEYTLTWTAVEGYLTPGSDTQTLAADGTITFSGTYNVNPGPTDDFVQIPSGVFVMGSPSRELGRNSFYETQHTVTLTHRSEMLSTEVTNQQYAELAQWALANGHCTATASSLRDALDGSTQELLDLDGGSCEISFSGGVFTVDTGKENHPVKYVTWYGAVSYCDWLSLQNGLSRAYDHDTWQCNGNAPYSAQGYRLPTEAEREFACRAGRTTAFANGEITDTECSDPNLDQIGWYCGNADDWTHPVGELMANARGLYDMHGNLYEWCNEWWGGGDYSGDATDPVGNTLGEYRALRGGCWYSDARGCRSAHRDRYHPNHGSDRIGFRPVRSTN